MDERRQTPEELAREMLDLFRAAGVPEQPVDAIPPLDNPTGLLAEIERWAFEHPEAAHGLTRAYVEAAAAGPDGAGLENLVAACAECRLAFEELSDDALDRFLVPRAPRILTAPNGTTKWTLMTAVTDREHLIREIVGELGHAPRPRVEPPAVPIHLAEAHHADELRTAFGFSFRDVLDIGDEPPARAAPHLFGPLLDGLRAAEPQTAAGMTWLMQHAPAALHAMPFTSGVTDALIGATEPRPEMQQRFVSVIEQPGLGLTAFVVWDTASRLSTRTRRQLAGHIRYVSDMAVAPWNRYGDLRRRREAFAVWVHALRRETLNARGLARALRSRYPSEYGESESVTIRRMYRISTQLGNVRMPQALMKEFVGG